MYNEVNIPSLQHKLLPVKMEWKPKRSFQLTGHKFYDGVKPNIIDGNTNESWGICCGTQLVCTCRGVLDPEPARGGRVFQAKPTLALVPACCPDLRCHILLLSLTPDVGSIGKWPASTLTFTFSIIFAKISKQNQAVNLQKIRCSVDWEEFCVTKDGSWNCVSWDPTKRGEW